MRWQRGHRSRNVEDRRHQGGARRGGGSLLPILFMLARSRLGMAAIVVFFGVMWVSGVDPLTLISGGGAPSGARSGSGDAAEEELAQFVGFVLDDAQQTWTEVLAGTEQPYRDAKLVLFRDSVDSACGFAQAASGPFYCPGDERVYIDLGFYDDLRRNFGAPGDFAQAYVIAHEIGHHVQNVLGIERGGPQPAAKPSGRRQRAVGAHGATSRLLRRCLGKLREPRRTAGSRRSGRRPQRRRRNRRRPHPGKRRAHRKPRRLHPRLGGTAGRVVTTGLRSGDAGGV